ncbi:MAG: DUF1801 domain-containing protein [Porphyrobacter sp.]|nr:DUF1801 domain-containing protein [Porphyrobacter sp.]
MGTEAEALERMIERYSPEVAELGRSLIAQMRARIPQANALVYDNYNALGVGFARDHSSSGVIISVVLYPRWVSLFFFKGALLDDPAGLLQGSGTIIRHIRFQDAAEFARPEVESLIAAALDLVEPPLDPTVEGRLVIKSISARQRPRRPA